jgi:aldose 1-epimerase
MSAIGRAVGAVTPGDVNHTTVTVTEEPFGEVGGEEIKRYTLRNRNGMRVRILSYGGIVQALEVPDRDGRVANVVLGFRTVDEYRRYNPAPSARNPEGANAYFGALIGRYAGPLGDGKFSLGGETYRVPMNAEGFALHGGPVGFDQKVWKTTVVSDGASGGVLLEYVSRAGEMGFPGTLQVSATYDLDGENQLTLTLRAISDAPTVLNLTNHIYWNLAGEGSGSASDHLLQIAADYYTPMNLHELPTGDVSAVTGTPFDFTRAMPIGERILAGDEQLMIGHGYDHNWVLRQADPPSLIRAARATDPRSGRTLAMYTTQPGLQVYTANLLQGNLIGSGGCAYREGDGFVLEAQHFPDSPNHPNFPSTALSPGEVYNETIVFQLSVER